MATERMLNLPYQLQRIIRKYPESTRAALITCVQRKIAEKGDVRVTWTDFQDCVGKCVQTEPTPPNYAELELALSQYASGQTISAGEWLDELRRAGSQVFGAEDCGVGSPAASGATAR